jgi:hypothetical protein
MLNIIQVENDRSQVFTDPQDRNHRAEPMHENQLMCAAQAGSNSTYLTLASKAEKSSLMSCRKYGSRIAHQ